MIGSREDVIGVAENVETVRRFYAVSPGDQDEPRSAFFAPDAVWHVPGKNPVSGDYHGVEAITHDITAKMQPLDELSVDARHVMGNGNIVVGIVHVKGRRKGRSVSGHGAHVFRFDDSGRIVEAWGFNEDQAEIAQFLRA